jgi:hypothetical protein
VRKGRHAISADIYGVNYADAGTAAALGLALDRWGGNSTTRYNWQNDTSNHASDWYFENIPNDNANPAALPDGSSSDLFVEENLRAGAETLARHGITSATSERKPNDPTSWGKVGRNETCPCGSGKKYKHCHGRFA